jgi:hypothetical protein
VSRLRRFTAAFLTTALLSSGLAACDRLGYEKNWPASSAMLVVRHDDGLILVGIDPTTGAAHPFAPVPDVHIDPHNVPEAAVLRTDAGIFLLATEGADSGILVRVDLANHKLVKVGDLSSARLPIVDGRILSTVGGSGDSFQSHRFTLDAAAPAESQRLGMTPITSDGRCLTGTIGSGQTVHIGLVGRKEQPATPRDLGTGVPGGVACGSNITLVTVSALNAAEQQPPAGTEMLVIRGDGAIGQIKVGRQPHQVAVDANGSTAAVAVTSDTGPAVQRVDLGTGRVISTTTLAGGLQAEVMTIRDGKTIVIGGNQGVLLQATGDHATTLKLPGENVTVVWN